MSAYIIHIWHVLWVLIDSMSLCTVIVPGSYRMRLNIRWPSYNIPFVVFVALCFCVRVVGHGLVRVTKSRSFVIHVFVHVPFGHSWQEGVWFNWVSVVVDSIVKVS